MLEITRDDPMKWKNMKRKERRIIAPNEGVYASPQARPVRRRKKESRYVNEGSGRCQVFFVSAKQVEYRFRAAAGSFHSRLTFLYRGQERG